MTARFVDTNVLLYAISTDPHDVDKGKRARELLDEADLALSTQVLQEFYVQATRATRADALTPEQAGDLVEAFARFPVQDVTLAVVRGALTVQARHGLSHWDAAIIAAAQALGCDTVLSVDLSHGQVYDGVRVVNPFM